ncbi:C-C motif chemokine 16, partial [Pipistrellus kuhlii]
SGQSSEREVVRVQSAKWSERERPAARRTSPFSCLLRLNCPTERMKVFVAALFLLILSLATVSTFEGQPRSPAAVNLSTICCFKYRHEKKVLPRKQVVGYRNALNCNLPAIVLVTNKNTEVCTNPSKEWVQNYINDPKLPLLPPVRSI